MSKALPPHKRIDLWVVWYSENGLWILEGVHDTEEKRDRAVAKMENMGRIVQSRRLMTCTPEQPSKYRAHRWSPAQQYQSTDHW